MPYEQTELFIGLVGTVGTDLERVVAELTTRLNYFDYEVTELHLSRYLADLNWDLKLPEGPSDVRVREHMTAGSELRRRLVTTPRRCPKKRRWSFSDKHTFADGSFDLFVNHP